MPKLRYDCDFKGCFNKHKRPKLEEFDTNLPGKIAFTDIDGVVEVNGRFLYLEMKSPGVPIPTGQEILFTRRTMDSISTVYVVNGDAETMECEKVTIYRGGKKDREVEADLDELKRMIGRWCEDSENKGMVSNYVRKK